MSSPQPATASNKADAGPFARAVKGVALLLPLSVGVLYLMGALAESEARYVLGLKGILAAGALRERYLVNGFIYLNAYLLIGVGVLLCCVVLSLILAGSPKGRLILNKISFVRNKIRESDKAAPYYWPALASLLLFLVGFVVSLHVGHALTKRETLILPQTPPSQFPNPDAFICLGLESSAGVLLVALATITIYRKVPRRWRDVFLYVGLSMCAVNATLIARAAGFASVLRNHQIVRIYGSPAVSDKMELLFLDADDKNIAALSRPPDRAVILIPRSDIKRLLITGIAAVPQFLSSSSENGTPSDTR